MQYSNNALVLDSIISSFSPEYVAAHAIKFADLITSAECSAYPQYLLYSTLGVNLVLSAPAKVSKKAANLLMNPSPLQNFSQKSAWFSFFLLYFFFRTCW